MRKTKILIVDDEVAFTNVVKLTLELNDLYDVCVENDPLLAIATAQNYMPDIILMDVTMPEMDGFEIEAQVKADPTLRDVPILFLTAVVRQQEVDEYNGLIGGQYFIAKPVDSNALIRAIEEHSCSGNTIPQTNAAPRPY